MLKHQYQSLSANSNYCGLCPGGELHALPGPLGGGGVGSSLCPGSLQSPLLGRLTATNILFFFELQVWPQAPALTLQLPAAGSRRLRRSLPGPTFPTYAVFRFLCGFSISGITLSTVILSEPQGKGQGTKFGKQPA